MSPKERHALDAQIQSAALRHYARLCRDKLKDGADYPVSRDNLAAYAERADQLADSYGRLQVAL